MTRMFMKFEFWLNFCIDKEFVIWKSFYSSKVKRNF